MNIPAGKNRRLPPRDSRMLFAFLVAAVVLLCSYSPARSPMALAAPPFKSASLCLVIPMADRGGGTLEPAGSPGSGVFLGESPAVLVTQASTMAPAGVMQRYALVMIAQSGGGTLAGAYIFESVLALKENDLVVLRFVRFEGSGAAERPKGVAGAKGTNLSKGMELYLASVQATGVSGFVPAKLVAALSDAKSALRVECSSAWPGGGGIVFDGTGRAVAIIPPKTGRGEKGFQFEAKSIEAALPLAEKARIDPAIPAMDPNSDGLAKVGAVAFCSELKNDGTAKSPGTMFDSGSLRELFAVVDFSGFSRGLQMREVWSFEGRIQVDKVYAWTGNRTGYLSLRWDNGGRSFAAGKYSFALYVDGSIKASGDFSVGAVAATAGVPVRVKGRVIDADTKRGVDSVTIGILKAGLAVTTWDYDETKLATIALSETDGSFEFPDTLARGNSYSVFVTAYGYEPINADYALKIPKDQGDPFVITITVRKYR